MATTTHTPRRKAAQKSRTVRVCVCDAETRSALIRIDEDGQSAHYHIREIPADGGIGYRVQKHVLEQDGSTTLNEPYHVLLADDGFHTCECVGFERWGRCRHFLALLACRASGKLS